MKQPEEKQITVRTLYRELPRISEAVAKGQRFAVTKHGKPIFIVSAIRQDRGERFTLDDIRMLQWQGGAKDLSQRVDEIVYGQ